jgi:hypothetical protein
VSIAASANPICAGTSVTFTATPTNGGTSPSYQWRLNGANVGTNSPTYTNAALANGNTVSVVMTSNAPCASGSPATSNTITMTVNTLPVASINYAGSPYCSNAGLVDVTLTGTTGGMFSAVPAGLSIDPVTGQINTLLSATGSYTVTYTLAASGGCGEVTTTASVVINADGSWTGTISTDWNTSGNWECNSLPLITTNVVVPGSLTNYPVLSSGAPGTANNITLFSGTSLIVSGNTLQIAGIVSNSGTFTAANGTIELKGSVSQSIDANLFSGNTILNLTISNPQGVNLLGTLNISGVLKAGIGNLTTGGYLTLLSTATQTALIDGAGMGTVNGNVTMQRYLPNGFGYKYVSSPFQNASVGGFAAEIDLEAAFPTFYRYEENRDATGWITYVDPSGVLTPMAGYAANSGTSTAAKTLSLTASVNNGALAPVTLYNRDKTYTKGFNLMGNPYPSPIDWNASSGWTRNNIDNAIYYFDAGATDQYTGTYSTYINGISSNGTATNIIASMQGFFVHVSDGAYPVSGSFGMDNRVRVNNLSPAFHKSSDDLYRPVIRLSAGFDEGYSISDPLVIYFDETATSGFENELDAIKLNNTDPEVPNFYALSEEGKRLSIGAWPAPDENFEIPLGIKTGKPGMLNFSLASAQNLNPGLGVFLKDKVSGIVQNLQQKSDYKVYLSEGDVQNRFTLIFSDKDISQEAFGSGSVDAYVEDGLIYVIIRLKEEQVNVSLHNIAGQSLINRNFNGEGHHKLGQAPAPGVYVVTVFTGMGTVSKKILVK